MSSPRHPLIAHRDRAVLVVVDVQEKLFPLMQEREVLASRIAMLMQGAAVLELPVIVTEQYRKGLGPTIQEVMDAAPATVIEKSTFSCLGDEGFTKALHHTERSQVIICGIEAHICVLQTGLDLLARGFDVFCVADAVSTRLPHTEAWGVARLREAGAVPVTAEGVLFELLERCDGEDFKAILPLVRDGR